MQEIILSIVVPTKDRYETLNVLIESLMTWEEQGFELIVQDNSSDTTPVIALLEKYKADHRLVYHHHEGQISATENGDKAMAYVKGHYVTLLGDDDGLVPQSVDLCRWMKRNDVDALSCQRASYTWPDISFKYAHNNQLKGKLIYKPYKGTLNEISAKNELKKVAKVGASSMLNLPRLYHGFVKRECLDKVLDICGTYFPGPVIDMSSAVSIIPHIKNYWSTDIPFVISGNCRKSMAGKNLVKQHQGDIKSQKSLPADTHDLWSSIIPKYWSGPTIWAETFIKACERSGQEGIVEKFNFEYVYANCIAFTDSKYYSSIWEVIKIKSALHFVKSILKSLFLLAIITIKRMLIASEKILKLPKRNSKIVQLEDIDSVMKYVSYDIQQKNQVENFTG